MWDDPAIDEITAEDLNGDYPAIQYGPPAGEFYLEIMARFGDGFAFSDVARQTVDLEGMTAQVATPMALYRMKKDSVRAIDREDAARLRERFRLDKE